MAVPRILVVDDDADVRRVYTTVLRQRYEVEEVSGGAAALERLAEDPFQLVILDLHMPEVDGFAVLDQLAHKAAKNRDIPIIVVTADGTDESRSRALRSRSVYLLCKPVPIRVLASLVETTLERAAEGKKTARPAKG